MSRRNRRPLPAGEPVVEILDLATDGRGVARVEGKVVFVADALPGERVRIRYLAAGRDADEAQALAVEQASPDRVTPGCAHFGVCGGCALQHLAPAAQLAAKQKWLADAFERLGKVQPAQWAPPLAGPVWGYRRRARLGVKQVAKKGGVLVGFRERRSFFLAQLSRCEVLDPRVGGQLGVIAEALAGLSIADRIPQIEMSATGHVCLALRVLSPPTASDLERLRALAAATGFELRLQPGGLDSIQPLQPPARRLDYSPDGSALRLAFEVGDFIQVNGPLSQQVVRQALDWLAPQPGEAVLELFCGLGNFSLPLARHGVQLTALEGDAGLVARARANAAEAGLSIAFDKADLFQPEQPATRERLRGPFDAVLLDPPRAGAEAVLPAIAATAARRVLYVSCHPGTLARDAGRLVHEHGFTLARAGVMDMFPHTAHVESMALFLR
ncbi:MAG TPA: 23S rRNA (uracil(1939)-C(5))-methyltransferase RlmD [Nevskiaceae bacterium]|nr:23S rRNA (uracil(1939)-C(5))-methyltransferase RlmD [Nevskiaceae bacterium]